MIKDLVTVTETVRYLKIKCSDCGRVLLDELRDDQTDLKIMDHLTPKGLLRKADPEWCTNKRTVKVPL